MKTLATVLAEITPLPWKLDGNHIMDGRNSIAMTARGWADDEINAAYLCHAANALPELVKAAKLEQYPWPVSVWTMTDDEYVKAVPCERLRTAISGFLMREGWKAAQMTIAPAIARAERVE